MAFSLFPREIKFFELFSEQNRKIAEAAALLQEIFADPGEVPSKCADIEEIEKEGNFIYRAISRKLSLTFITSIDREDIHDLNVAQEDVLNAIRAVSSRMGLYEFPVVSNNANQLVSHLRGLTEETGKMLNCLKMRTEGDEEIRDATKLKAEADKLVLVALKEICEQKSPDQEEILAMMKWTQIYDRLEEVISRLDRLVHVIEGIMLKYV